MGAVIVVDAFWGDSGKGKIAAHLARRLGATYGVRAGTGTNAGHSVYMEDGKLLKLNQLPAALVEKESQVRVGSGVAVDPECGGVCVEAAGSEALLRDVRDGAHDTSVADPQQVQVVRVITVLR